MTPSGDVRAAIAGLLAERYGTSAPRLEPVYEEPAKAIYRVERSDGQPWILRYFPPTRPLERAAGDAAIMRYVAAHGIPAERPVSTLDGARAAELEGRAVLVTERIHGARPDRSPETLRLLGEAVGRIHALPPVPPDDPRLTRRAGALPRQDLPYGRECLARIRGSVPASLQEQYEALRVALDATHDCEDAPAGLIHSDCHPDNARHTPEGEIVFFDWDGGGHGPRVAALGLLLYGCAVQSPDDPPQDPAAEAHPLDLTRVDAVLHGYCAHYHPSVREIERLPDAARFRPAVVAARELARAVDRGESQVRRGWWTRWAEADTVARRARQVLGGRS